MAQSKFSTSVSRPAMRHPVGVAGMLLVAALALAPWREAHAYIDPNSAGPLYQFLFPFLIAAASALAAARRYIARLFSRLMQAVVTAVRGERRPPQTRGDS